MADSRMALSSFWPRYVLAHRHPGTQWLHLAGTLAGVGCLAAALVTLNAWWIPAGLVVGYGFAWLGHFWVEHSRPATFSHPFLSFVCDFRMAYCTLTGRMGREVERALQAAERPTD